MSHKIFPFKFLHFQPSSSLSKILVALLVAMYREGPARRGCHHFGVTPFYGDLFLETPNLNGACRPLLVQEKHDTEHFCHY